MVLRPDLPGRDHAFWKARVSAEIEDISVNVRALSVGAGVTSTVTSTSMTTPVLFTFAVLLPVGPKTSPPAVAVGALVVPPSRAALVGTASLAPARPPSSTLARAAATTAAKTPSRSTNNIFFFPLCANLPLYSLPCSLCRLSSSELNTWV